MNYEELQQEVLLKLKDESSEILVRIPDLVNDAIGLICEDVDLPALKTLGSITTALGVAYTAMPSNSTGRLLYAGTSEGQLMIYKEGLEGLLSYYVTLDNEGDLEAICLEGNVVYYQNIPAEETAITVLYLRDPTLLVSNVDIPTYIPLVAHRETIVPKTCELAYGIIESKMGDKPNTDRYSAEYEMGKAKLLAWVSKRVGPREKTIWDV